ncbi:DegT/DnrJ/EryC1/StrS family aminotransferase [Sphingomonas sp. AOB5]|uniref:DegT/DnrJ/EryC1/StrS family aminotransferase n=1 Tax=Sphingomonas sp. AOB5 TaxID=3034017 RepID=UPI0023F7A6F1|nr:DegT/DnrJ/EryC1/StrS family aminotransferase [Sphingomonas sp. AOB5]MDF7776965.1 DegT/DnrJ/EryC1/StrS family aminotransferase [Sphingomonas sp. AOB5]
MDRLPLIAPEPPRLSELQDELRAIEQRGLYSNGGPVVRGFESDLLDGMFGGQGDCLAVGNATLGLMLAIRQAAGPRSGRGMFALMPGFTFAATAHAAEWAGLTPLICDVDPGDWAAAEAAEAAAFARYGDKIAVVVPYATFGAAIDLERYRSYTKFGTGVVVDAAASLGALDAQGKAFGAGAPFAIVYSMHATKVFATAEGGVIHSGDAGLIEQLRRMTNFGFAGGRSAEGPGFNAKLPEVLGVLAAEKLKTIEAVAEHRAALDRVYRERLGSFASEHGFEFQVQHGRRQAVQCQSILLPRQFAGHRKAIMAALAEQGIGTGQYFSPHLGEQPWFRANAVIDPLPVCDDISARILSLPVTDGMTEADVDRVCVALMDACARLGRDSVSRERRGSFVHDVLIVGGGPAGTALLTAATKRDRLVELAEGGLAVVERDAVLGRGAIGNYAITSDSTAETFLTAVKDNVHGDVAAVETHLSGQEIALHKGGKIGVPLARTTPFLEATGVRLGEIVAENGGYVATRSEVVEARRQADGLWAARVRNLSTGQERVMRTASIVIATGGYQSREHIEAEQVAGTTLGELAGRRLMLGDDFLAIGGVDRLRERIADNRSPRIAIIGGSTSAMAAAALILKASPALELGAGALLLYHRRPLRPFYHSVEAAWDDGFTDFGPDDVCPVSGFVYRLAGFRLEARELILRMLAVGGRAPDPRMALRQIGGNEEDIRAEIAGADVVIGALGYRPRALPLFDAAGERIALMADAPGRPRLVDQQCRVLDAEGRPVPGVYGIGLASGHVPDGKLGGESSFSGKANGLWLWQNDIGLMIVDQLLERSDARKVA